MPSKDTILRSIEIDSAARWDFACSLMDELKPWAHEDTVALLDIKSGYAKLVTLEALLARAMYLRAAEAAKEDRPTNIPEGPLR